jgi:hypothetical protein
MLTHAFECAARCRDIGCDHTARAMIEFAVLSVPALEHAAPLVMGPRLGTTHAAALRMRYSGQLSRGGDRREQTKDKWVAGASGGISRRHSQPICQSNDASIGAQSETISPRTRENGADACPVALAR